MDFTKFLLKEEFKNEICRLDADISSMVDNLDKNYIKKDKFNENSKQTKNKLNLFEAKLFELVESIKEKGELIKKLDEFKADKTELDALKRFVNSIINQGSGGTEFTGLEELEIINKRIKALELFNNNVMLLKEKEEINKHFEEVNNSIKDINEVKI